MTPVKSETMPTAGPHSGAEDFGLAQLVADFVGVLDNFSRTQRELIDSLQALRRQLPSSVRERPPLWLPPPPATTPGADGGRLPPPPSSLPPPPRRLPPPPPPAPSVTARRAPSPAAGISSRRLPPPPSGWTPLPTPATSTAAPRQEEAAPPSARAGPTPAADGPPLSSAAASTSAATKRDYDYFAELDEQLAQLRGAASVSKGPTAGGNFR